MQNYEKKTVLNADFILSFNSFEIKFITNVLMIVCKSDYFTFGPTSDSWLSAIENILYGPKRDIYESQIGCHDIYIVDSRISHQTMKSHTPVFAPNALSQFLTYDI